MRLGVLKEQWLKMMLLVFLLGSFVACSSPKSGCPAEESRAKAIKANKKVRKQSKTELFPKEMKKRMNNK